MKTTARPPADSSLERGLAILEEIAAVSDHTPASLAQATGLPVSTVYRYLRTLRERGFVREDRSRYEPGPALLALTGRHFAQSHLAEIGPAVLGAIVDLVGETCVLVIRVGTRALCLRRVEPDKAIRYTFGVNELLPLHAGAGQRVLLSWAPDAVVDRLLAPDHDLPRYTEKTLSREQLLQSIPIVRQTGWAVSRGEYDAGSVSIAVPVFFGGEVVCSLNVAGPQSRCGSRDWAKRVVRILLEAAADLSDALETWAATAPAQPHSLVPPSHTPQTHTPQTHTPQTETSPTGETP
ncbi:IclR family transcriptional regulator [Homoserinimonas sp. OAct 916]|uniref:IclR family transcriptional regulator n=1 Tax=Homoserinimonas sp. OAct 916 TaxID=2211450 RepID=UPI000DBE482D|nr:IclR family transcriptional regulator [Homoserinimonas sp. OAct 916]